MSNKAKHLAATIRPLGPSSPYQVDLCPESPENYNPSASVIITNTHGFGHNLISNFLTNSNSVDDESELTLALFKRVRRASEYEPRSEFLIHSRCYQDPSYEFVYAYTKVILDLCQTYCKGKLIRLDHITQACGWNITNLQDGTLRGIADYIMENETSLPRIILDHGGYAIDLKNSLPRAAQLPSPTLRFMINEEQGAAITAQNLEVPKEELSEKFELVRAFHFEALST